MQKLNSKLVLGFFKQAKLPQSDIEVEGSPPDLKVTSKSTWVGEPDYAAEAAATNPVYGVRGRQEAFSESFFAN